MNVVQEFNLTPTGLSLRVPKDLRLVGLGASETDTFVEIRRGTIKHPLAGTLVAFTGGKTAFRRSGGHTTGFLQTLLDIPFSAGEFINLRLHPIGTVTPRHISLFTDTPVDFAIARENFAYDRRTWTPADFTITDHTTHIKIGTAPPGASKFSAFPHDNVYIRFIMEAGGAQDFYFRCDGTLSNGYRVRIEVPAAIADVLLQKVVAGTVTTLMTVGVDLVAGTWYSFGVSAYGPIISLWHDWLTYRGTVIDTTFASGTHIGFYNGSATAFGMALIEVY